MNSDLVGRSPPGGTEVAAERVTRLDATQLVGWSLRCRHRRGGSVCDERGKRWRTAAWLLLHHVEHRVDVLDYCNGRRQTEHDLLCNNNSRSTSESQITKNNIAAPELEAFHVALRNYVIRSRSCSLFSRVWCIDGRSIEPGAPYQSEIVWDAVALSSWPGQRLEDTII